MAPETRLIPDLLYLMSQEVIAFQQDNSAEVRKCVIGFMEEAWYVYVSMLYTASYANFGLNNISMY